MGDWGLSRATNRQIGNGQSSHQISRLRITKQSVDQSFGRSAMRAAIKGEVTERRARVSAEDVH